MSDGPENADEMDRERDEARDADGQADGEPGDAGDTGDAPGEPANQPKEILAKPFEGARAPARFAGVVYQFNAQAQGWSRHMLRRYADKGNYWSQTIFVPLGRAFCLACLGTDVRLDFEHTDTVRAGGLWYCCQSKACGARYQIIDEPPAQ